MISKKQIVGHARGMEDRPSIGKNDACDICSFYVLPCHTLVIGHSRFLWLQVMISCHMGSNHFQPKGQLSVTTAPEVAVCLIKTYFIYEGYEV